MISLYYGPPYDGLKLTDYDSRISVVIWLPCLPEFVCSGLPDQAAREKLQHWGRESAQGLYAAWLSRNVRHSKFLQYKATPIQARESKRGLTTRRSVRFQNLSRGFGPTRTRSDGTSHHDQRLHQEADFTAVRLAVEHLAINRGASCGRFAMRCNSIGQSSLQIE